MSVSGSNTASTVGVNTADDFILSKQKKMPDNSMGKDQFLKLLLVQMQNQDPTAPMENTDMMAQMAQFSALEAMQAMSGATSASQAYSIIGKGIVGFIRDAATGAVTEVVGTVDSAGVENGSPFVRVGNATVPLENIQQVFDNSIISGDSTQLLTGTSMVGKFIRAEFPTASGSEYIEGRVERVSVRDGKLYATVNGGEVGLYQVINVADTLEALGERPASPPPAEESAADTEEETAE
ncbi:MAG: hypothetical protein LBR85_03965 [Oscillospiraceae bacterium]|jgi:flagellar basal-body rod modification protein FlgD|nr:hypothetical protein [Oscillospiraceae bacterium]